MEEGREGRRRKRKEREGEEREERREGEGRRVTKHFNGRWAVRGRAPPVLMHAKKAQDQMCADDPFCLPHGHLVQSAVCKRYPVTLADIKRVLIPCCTRQVVLKPFTRVFIRNVLQVIYPHRRLETYYCKSDILQDPRH